MNKELFSKLWTQAKENSAVDGLIFFPAVNEEFARLIVCESISIADDYVKDCTCDEHIECKHPRSAIGRKIEQHFGVKK